MIERAITTIFYFGPLLFAVGFIAPLTAQILRSFEITPPFGVSPLMAGLCLGGVWGLYAQIKGSWI